MSRQSKKRPRNISTMSRRGRRYDLSGDDGTLDRINENRSVSDVPLAATTAPRLTDSR